MLGEEMGNYVLVTTAVSDANPGMPAGAINGGFFPKKPDWPAQYPSIVIGVGDIREAMNKVTQAGGKRYSETILRQVGQADHFVLLLSVNSKDSTWVAFEVGAVRAGLEFI